MTTTSADTGATTEARDYSPGRGRVVDTLEVEAPVLAVRGERVVQGVHLADTDRLEVQRALV
jgi:hypothetical protein